MDHSAVSLKTVIKQFVCFRLADEEYGIDIQYIQEVINVPRITQIPQMPDFCLGVINSRGNITPVFDLRRKFFLAEKEFGTSTKIFVADLSGGIVGFVVDDVLDSVKFDMMQIDPAPAVKMNIDREYIQGLGQLEGRMIVILDLEKMHDHILRDIFSRTTISR